MWLDIGGGGPTEAFVAMGDKKGRGGRERVVVTLSLVREEKPDFRSFLKYVTLYHY